MRFGRKGSKQLEEIRKQDRKGLRTNFVQLLIIILLFVAYQLYFGAEHILIPKKEIDKTAHSLTTEASPGSTKTQSSHYLQITGATSQVCGRLCSKNNKCTYYEHSQTTCKLYNEKLTKTGE